MVSVRKDWWLPLLGMALQSGCNGCSGVVVRPVKVEFTINGMDPAEACSRQGVVRVVARSRWSGASNEVETRENDAECSKGSVTVDIGGPGSIQLTAYDREDNGTVMGTSAPEDVDPTSPEFQTNQEITLDIIALRGTLNVAVTCGGGSCEGQVVTSGDGAPTFSVFLDTNGADLEPVEPSQPLTMGPEGRLVGTTRHAQVEAVNVVRAQALTPTGSPLRGEVTVYVRGLTANADVDLRPAANTQDGGVQPVSSSTSMAASATSSVSAPLSSSGGSSSQEASSAQPPSSSGTAVSSSSTVVASSSEEESSSLSGSPTSLEASSSLSSTSSSATSLEASSSDPEASSSQPPSSSHTVSSSAGPSSHQASSSEPASSTSTGASSAEESSSASPGSSAGESSSSADTVSSFVDSSSSASN